MYPLAIPTTFYSKAFACDFINWAICTTTSLPALFFVPSAACIKFNMYSCNMNFLFRVWHALLLIFNVCVLYLNHEPIDIMLQDELEITSRLLGRKGGYSGTIVLLKNKATGELIAEGRHSLFGRHNSKM